MKTLKHYKAFLELKKPITLRIETKGNKKLDAYYLPEFNDKGKLKSHRITIYTENTERSFNTLLAHELIHAKQAELNSDEFHGKIFKKYARKFAKKFNIRNIFIKGVDTK